MQALSTEKRRLLQILNIMGASDQSRLLPTLLRRCAASVEASLKARAAPPGTVFDQTTTLALRDADMFPLMVVEALLGFLNMCAASSQCATALTTGGAIPSLLQMVAVGDEPMIMAVSQTLRILELMVDRAANALPIVRQLDGSDLLIRRLEVPPPPNPSFGRSFVYRLTDCGLVRLGTGARWKRPGWSRAARIRRCTSCS